MLEPFEPHHLDESYDLACKCSATAGLSSSEWRAQKTWSTFDNPYRDHRPSGFVLREGREMVALMDIGYTPFLLNGWRGVAACLSNICVRPDKRGPRGIQFIRQALERIDEPVVYGAHFSERAAGLFRRLGAVPCPGTDATFEATITLSVRVRQASLHSRSIRLLSALGLGWLGVMGLVLRGERRVRAPVDAMGGGGVVSPDQLDPQAVDRVCAAASTLVDLGVARDYAYLQWRYQQHPRSRDFHWLALEGESGGLKALAILDHRPQTMEAYLCEAVFVPQYPDACAAAIALAVERARALGTATLRSKAVCPAVAQMLRRWEFKESAKPFDQFLLFSKLQVLDMSEKSVWFSYGDFKPF